MNVWIIKLAEPTHRDKKGRIGRCGMLIEELLSAKHEVTWWHTTFEHYSKSYRYYQYHTEHISPMYRINFLHGPKYKKNMSFSRLHNHDILAKEFTRLAPHEKKPDIIICSIPTLEITYAALLFAKRLNVPLVVDVRDLWPDIFIEKSPWYAKPFTRVIFAQQFFFIQQIMKQAVAIITISDSYMKWALNYAQRSISHFDRVIPIGYKKEELNFSLLQSELNKLYAQGVNKNKQICCFIGTLATYFDDQLIMNAAKILISQGDNNIQFVIAGEGEKYQSFLEKSKSFPNIVSLGWIDKNAIFALMSIAVIGLVTYIPNSTLSLTNKPFEYMSAGLGLISSLENDLKDLIDQHQIGINYQSGNVTSFLLSLEMLLQRQKDNYITKQHVSSIFSKYFSAEHLYRKYSEHIEYIYEHHYQTCFS